MTKKAPQIIVLNPDSTLREVVSVLFQDMLLNKEDTGYLFAVLPINLFVPGHPKIKSLGLTVKLESSELMPNELGANLEKHILDKGAEEIQH